MSNGPDTIQRIVYGFEGNEDQSLTRNPDVSGDFARHLVAAGTRFSPGTGLDGTIFWGCPSYGAPPLLQEMQPANGASAVSIDSEISVIFSEPVIFSESWHEITCTKSGYHTAVTRGSEASYTLTPDTPFAYEEDCLVTLVAAAITDLDGQPQPMEEDVQWQFATEREPDNAPQVVDSFPVDGAVGVARTATLTITFSEPVNLSETAVELVCSHGGIVPLALSGGPSQFQVGLEIELEMGEHCILTINAEGVNDLDGDDPPDQMTADWQISFSSEVADFLLINEVDSETPGIDDAEFIELFDGGRGRTRLDGLSIVLFSGHENSAYASFDLSGQQTDDNGYFLLGSRSVVGVDLVIDDSLLQNGVDAVALYQASAAEMPVGTTVTTDKLFDALVYGADPANNGLLILLHPGETMVNEDARTLDAFHSLQRCPDGSGGQRRTGTVWPDLPTPKEANTCIKDEEPRIQATIPADGADNVPVDGDLMITFSEQVNVQRKWFEINCQRSGRHEATSSGGGVQHSLRPAILFAYGEQCQVTIFAENVHDLDAADPPDHLPIDYSWIFTVLPARHMLINEVDADTAGVDTAEFIELYDGGDGSTVLDGMEVVLYTGADDRAYRHIDLSGYQTNENGYFVIGGSAVSGVDLVIATGAIQNGPDAVALYGRDESNRCEPQEKGLLDALVYHTNDKDDPGLSFLLLENEPQVNEGFWRDPVLDSNQRCPNGQGGQRVTSGYVQNQPTPGAANNCTVDNPPDIVQVFPADGTIGVALDNNLIVEFSEPVQGDEAWIALSCEQQGIVDLAVIGGPEQYVIQPASLAADDSCKATINGDRIHDLDGYADTLAGDYSWQFATGSSPTGISAGFTSSSPATIGEAVRFFNTSHGPPPLTYEWDFGDGSPLGNEVEPEHWYMAVGTYSVTLTVRTSRGETAVYSAVVEILPAHVYVPIFISP